MVREAHANKNGTDQNQQSGIEITDQKDRLDGCSAFQTGAVIDNGPFRGAQLVDQSRLQRAHHIEKGAVIAAQPIDSAHDIVVVEAHLDLG